MKKITVLNHEYEIIEDYKEAFKNEEFLERYTSYFEDYDYILGDIAYNKLRLKGFYDENSPKVNKINNYRNKDKYLKEYCAVDCRYFILKKLS